MSRSNTNHYGQQEGDSIESMMEYDKDALGTTELEAGNAKQSWNDYAIELVPVHANGEDTGQRAVMRNGEFLAMVSDQYKLVPNEEVVQTADEVARDLGAVPFDEFTGDWYTKLHDHVFQDDEGRRAHALYAWNDPVDLGRGDEVQLGYAVHNSIDGSMGLQVSLFSFRHACANMVFIGVGGEGMDFDQRDVLTHSSRRHTTGLDVTNLKAWIETTVDYAPAIISAYEEWRTDALTADHALELLEYANRTSLSKSDLPAWLQRAADRLDEADERAAENEQLGQEQYDGGLSPEVRASVMQTHIPRAESRWDTYNDLTENVWHNGDTNDNTKLSKMRDVHRVFDPSVAESGVTLG